MTTTVEAILKERLAHYSAADEILRACHAEGRRPSGSEVVFLRSLNIDESSEKRRLHTLAQVEQWQAAAGTQRDRELTQAHLAGAKETLSRERARHEETIRRATEELRALENDVKQHEAAAERQAIALRNLRSPDVLPEHLRIDYLASKRAVNAGIGHECEKRRSRINSIDNILAFDGYGAQQWAALQPEHRHRLVDGRGSLHPSAWAQYCAELRAERDRLAGELIELQPEHDAERDRLAALLDHYVR